jgi:methylenetetrahydrofolate reductase (NADPH)
MALQRANGVERVTKIADILNRHERTVSFEFSPPRTDEAMATLEQTLVDLEPLGPSYVSVTYGAGGTTRERTHEIVTRINRETSMTAMAHLTCCAHTRSELVEIITRYRDAGVENLLALRGDPPKDLGLPPGELDYALDLVRLIRELGDFSVGVAAHPEPHPRSPSREADRLHTAEKLREADFAITQFFFDAHHYFELVESLHALGVDKPVIPGILPVLSIAATKRMADMQGSEFPAWFMAKLEAVQDDPKEVRRIGIEEATKLCQELLDGGAPGLHFYTMNFSKATREIYANLGLGT